MLELSHKVGRSRNAWLLYRVCADLTAPSQIPHKKAEQYRAERVCPKVEEVRTAPGDELLVQFIAHPVERGQAESNTDAARCHIKKSAEHAKSRSVSELVTIRYQS